MNKQLTFVALIGILAVYGYITFSAEQSSLLKKYSPDLNDKTVQISSVTHQNCNSCHTPNGEDFIASNGFLAGQGRSYITKQINDLAIGARIIENVNIVNHKLSTLEIENYAENFSNQSRFANVSEGSISGKLLYEKGDDARQIPACMSCHVKNGKGIDSADIPALSGQTHEYIIKQLIDFRAGIRSNDKNQMMQKIAIRLTDQDIEAISHHITSLK
ncbi:c-type cytochrome [Thalassotalea fonticola]|uniref:C-type cytochrome n=1 Tax=Thalassotalea fonticola TaxID=3065649 RepID=A0ABZ0GIP7_9GAMM|nr:c-type cytochrome [Colwelliaceae bacterium S1-1]